MHLDYMYFTAHPNSVTIFMIVHMYMYILYIVYFCTVLTNCCIPMSMINVIIISQRLSIGICGVEFAQYTALRGFKESYV